ncbi:MAG: hypothetical protein AB1758_26170 [Candidatus Eremiobacterota bacterium]
MTAGEDAMWTPINALNTQQTYVGRASGQAIDQNSAPPGERFTTGSTGTENLRRPVFQPEPRATEGQRKSIRWAAVGALVLTLAGIGWGVSASACTPSEPPVSVTVATSTAVNDLENLEFTGYLRQDAKGKVPLTTEQALKQLQEGKPIYYSVTRDGSKLQAVRGFDQLHRLAEETMRQVDRR